MPRSYTWGELTSAGPVSVRKMQDAPGEQFTVSAQPGGGASTKSESAPSSEAVIDTAPWVENPAPPSVARGEVIWHYTDASGFAGIVESGCLWATALAFLNDREEFAYGLSIFDQSVDDALESFYVHPVQKEFLQSVMEAARGVGRRLRTFVACASLASDSLAQWRGYSGGAGYAIGIDPEADPVVLSDGGDDGLAYDAPDMSWRRVLYVRDEQIDLVNRTLGLVLKISPTPETMSNEFYWQRAVRLAAAQVVTSSCYIKHPSFMEEQEVRSVLSVGEEEEGNIRRRVTPYGIAPYLRSAFIAPSSKREVPGKIYTAEMLPIKHLLLGPGPHGETRLQGAQDILRSAGYNVDVKLSSSPFR